MAMRTAIIPVFYESVRLLFEDRYLWLFDHEIYKGCF